MEQELGTRYTCDRHDCDEYVEVERFRDLPDDWYEFSILGLPPQSMGGFHRHESRSKTYHYCSFDHLIDGARKRLDTMEQRRRDQQERAERMEREQKERENRAARAAQG